MDQNLAWLTQKTEDPKSNKGNLTFPPHTVNMIELLSTEKVATPPISTSTPFTGLSSFLGKNLVLPHVTQFSEGPTPRFQLCTTSIKFVNYNDNDI